VQREKTNTKTGRTTGALKIRVTNEMTGKSILVNASGPGSQTETVDEAGLLTLVLDFTGRSIVYPFDPDERALFRAAGLPDIFATRGPVVGTVLVNTVTGEVESSTFDVARNRIDDLCDRIT